MTTRVGASIHADYLTSACLKTVATAFTFALAGAPIQIAQNPRAAIPRVIIADRWDFFTLVAGSSILRLPSQPRYAA